MAYAVAAGDPSWSLDPMELEKQVATFAKNNAITGQAAWLTFISTLDSANSIQVTRVLLRSVKCSAP